MGVRQPCVEKRALKMFSEFVELIILFSFVHCVNCFNVTTLNITEGSNCTYEDKPGKCVNFFKCERLVVDMPKKRYPPICSFDGEVPIVCCTSCKLVNNIDDSVQVTTGKIYFKNGDKSRDKCLEYSKYVTNYFAYFPTEKCKRLGDPNIFWSSEAQCHKLDLSYYSTELAIGGRDAVRGEYPHMALLGYGKISEIQWLCGGTLISEKFVLTAAHCVKSEELGPVTYVSLDLLKRDEASGRLILRVKTIIPHPEYKPPAKYHDIALLETRLRRIPFYHALMPACLPSPEEYVNDPALVLNSKTRLESALNLTAAGWGALGFRKELAETLQVIDVQGFNETECLEHYPPHASIPHGYNKTTQLCFGHKEKAIDTCEGDSGGPLQEYNEEYCTFTVLGVTSFGRACGFAGNAGIYTRVVYYVPWIESIIWKDN